MENDKLADVYEKKEAMMGTLDRSLLTEEASMRIRKNIIRLVTDKVMCERAYKNAAEIEGNELVA